MGRHGSHPLLMGFVVVLSVTVFLLRDHPVAFWLVFVPLALLFIFFTMRFLTGRGAHIGSFMAAIAILIVMVVALVIVATPEKCEHEDVLKRYVFASDDLTQSSTVSSYCGKCGQSLTIPSHFKGELVDKSYLNALVEHSDGNEIVAGEYYTVTATVPLGFYGYTSDTVFLTCEVENDDFIVRFHVEFREEFEELVRSVEKGDEITFRGRFGDKGCEFTDCELLSHSGVE